MVEVGNDFVEVDVEVALADGCNRRSRREVTPDSDASITKVSEQLTADDASLPMSMQQLDEVSLDLSDDDFSLSERKNVSSGRFGLRGFTSMTTGSEKSYL